RVAAADALAEPEVELAVGEVERRGRDHVDAERGGHLVGQFGVRATGDEHHPLLAGGGDTRGNLAHGCDPSSRAPVSGASAPGGPASPEAAESAVSAASAALADAVPGRRLRVQPSLTCWRARPTASAPGGTSSVMTDP